MNTLYYGDNLEVLREYIAAESVDLVYLDPPFNSNRDYNVIFTRAATPRTRTRPRSRRSRTPGTGRHTTEQQYQRVTWPARSRCGGGRTDAFRPSWRERRDGLPREHGTRLVELHRVLKPTGSLYLHCDPTMSHYLKVLLDAVFGARNFRNEIIWKRSESPRTTQPATAVTRRHPLLPADRTTSLEYQSLRALRRPGTSRISKTRQGAWFRLQAHLTAANARGRR